MKKKRGVLFFLSISLLAAPLAFSQNDLQPESTFEIQTDTPAVQKPGQSAPMPAQKGSLTELQPAGQIVWVSGSVKATYPEQTPRVLARGSMIYEKDTVVTDSASSGQLSFTDNSMVTLTPASTFIIEQYYFNQEKPQQGQTVMNLVKGGFRAVTGFVAKAAPSSYQIKTPVATIGVRGTDFQGSCPKIPGPCAFGLLHGRDLILINAAGTFTATPETPYASVASYTSKAVLSKLPPDILGNPPAITPANAPPPSKGVGSNCGILINN